MPESRDDRAAAVDWQGGVLAAIGLAVLADGLTQASDLGWTHPAVLAALFGGMVALFIFIRHETHAEAPMMPPKLFQSPAPT